jgi:LL-diaminopimelate aminotransferase
MIKGAARLQLVEEYYFSRKLEQIRQMTEAGADVINLGIGSPDQPPSLETIAAASAALNTKTSHGYATHRGTKQLREAIAKWYLSTYAVALDPAGEILPLLGSKEGILYVSLAFLDPGDGVLVPDPGYGAYSSVTRMIGARAIPYQLDAQKNWWPNFSELEKLDLTRIKIMWTNYPNMPTGARASRELFSRLIDFGRRHEILICHDNPYSLVLNPEPPLSILQFDPQRETSLELNSFSKSFNMAGWRVGMLLAHKECVDMVLQMKSNVDSGMFLAVQAAAAAALGNSGSWHQERNQLYNERRKLVFKIFDELGYQYDDKQVGLFVWAKAPDVVPDVVAHLDKVLELAQVFLTPGLIFGAGGTRYARASLCAPEERLRQALTRLEKLK